MSDDTPSCAHLDVGFLPVQHKDGTESESWRCESCGREFRPTPISPDPSHMTLGQLEALADRYGKAVATIKEAQALFGPGPVAAMLPAQMAMRQPQHPHVGAQVVPASPFPCPACGRTATEKPGEATEPTECLQCGNHLPLQPGSPTVLMTNKGPIMRITAAERAAAIGQPAFGPDGEPT